MNWQRVGIRSAVVAVLMGAAFSSLPQAEAQQRPRGNRRNNVAAAGVTVSDEQVVAAIKKGVDYLLNSKKNDNWETHNWIKQGQKGGQTAQVLYALLTVGESFNEGAEEDKRLYARSDELAPVIKWLCTKAQVEETYAAAFTTLALTKLKSRTPEVQETLDRMHAFMVASMWYEGGYQYNNKAQGAVAAHAAPPQEVRKAMAERVTTAMNYAHLVSVRRDYMANGKVADAKAMDGQIATAKGAADRAEAAVRATKMPDWFGDVSNSQYGTYAAWALADAGYEFPLAYWKVSDTWWRTRQLPNGGWPYSSSDEKFRENMGLAGVASLFVTQEFNDLTLRLDPLADKHIQNGLTWLNGDYHTKPKDLYYMYGVERIGLASGYKMFNKINWYMDGAKEIIAAQNPDGSWNTDHGEGQESVGTAYALLFLVRGRNPVLFNKLQYTGSWNARPRDTAHATEWISKKFEKPINWQVVDFEMDPSEWMDAPVLMISGSKPLSFSSAQIEKLRAYINAGGMIFSTTDNSSPTPNPAIEAAFTESVKQMASKIVEENGKPKYEMKELAKDDMMYSLKNELWTPISQDKPGDKPMRLLAMSNGVRNIWIHTPADMGATFQVRKTASVEHFNFIGNLYQYARGKVALRTKLQSINIAEAAGAPGKTISVARVDYAGNWDPEPGAWPRQAKYMTHAGVKLDVQNVKIDKLNPKSTPVAYMTGTTGFPANPDQIATMKKFIAGGGTVVFEAAGMSADYRKALDVMLDQLVGAGVVNQIALDSKLYNGSIPGSVDVTDVVYRLAYRLKIAKRTTPNLRGAMVDGRYAVIVSDEDLTAGMVGVNTWGILGYSPDSAQEVVRNILLYAADPKAGKDGPPAAAAAAGNQ